MFSQCACIVDRWVHIGYMACFQVHLECTQKQALHSRCTWNKPCTQHVPTCAQCRHIERTSVNYNSTVIANHIAGTCWGYIWNVREMLLVITLDANVEVTCEMWMKCIWSEHWKNFLPKPAIFPTCKHLFPLALAPSVSPVVAFCSVVSTGRADVSAARRHSL